MRPPDASLSVDGDVAPLEGDDADEAGPPVVAPPDVDEPGVDEPGVAAPGVDEPEVEEPGADEPGADEPGLDAPGADVPAGAPLLEPGASPLRLPQAVSAPTSARETKG